MRPQSAVSFGHLRFVVPWRRRDEQGFEVRPARLTATGSERHAVRHAAGAIVRTLPLARIIAIAPREQRAAHGSHQSSNTERVVAAYALGQGLHQPVSRKGKEVF